MSSGVLGPAEKASVGDLLASRGVSAEKFEAIFPLLWGTRRELIFDHFHQTHDLPSYLERFSASEIAKHLELLGELDQEYQAVAHVSRRPEPNMLDATIVGYDGRGVAALVTGQMASMGFDIRDIRVCTYDALSGKPAKYVLAIQLDCGRTPSADDPLSVELALREQLVSAYALLLGGKTDSGALAGHLLKDLVKRALDECTRHMQRQYEEQQRLLTRVTDAAAKGDFQTVQRLLIQQSPPTARPEPAPFLLNVFLTGALVWVAPETTVAEFNKVIAPHAHELRQSALCPANPLEGCRSDERQTNTVQSLLQPQNAAVLPLHLVSGTTEPGGFSWAKVKSVLGKFWGLQNKPLPVRLRELLHACDGDPDAPAVREFLQEYGDDPMLAEVKEGILVAFRKPAPAPLAEPVPLRQRLWRMLCSILPLPQSRRPLPVQLRELIHACDRNPDAQAVREFLAKHQSDKELAEQAPGIVAAYRRSGFPA